MRCLGRISSRPSRLSAWSDYSLYLEPIELVEALRLKVYRPPLVDRIQDGRMPSQAIAPTASARPNIQPVYREEFCDNVRTSGGDEASTAGMTALHVSPTAHRPRPPYPRARICAVARAPPHRSSESLPPASVLRGRALPREHALASHRLGSSMAQLVVTRRTRIDSDTAWVPRRPRRAGDDCRRVSEFKLHWAQTVTTRRRRSSESIHNLKREGYPVTPPGAAPYLLPPPGFRAVGHRDWLE